MDVTNPSAPAGRSSKYALRECERRFLLRGLPDLPIVRSVRITDSYLIGTRMRLRRWDETHEGSTATIYKFTQKIAAPAGGPGLITTFYLDATEYAALSAVPARQLHKTRYSMPPLVVDVFDPPLHGLMMAETEFETEEALLAFVPPPFTVAEVTRDARFNGGSLATVARVDLLRALADFGIEVLER